jgi:hypothetical protein
MTCRSGSPLTWIDRLYYGSGFVMFAVIYVWLIWKFMLTG